jgi:hypothetical protein
MSYSFTLPPTGDRDELRTIIGDVTFDDGPAPDRANISDEMLDWFLDSAGTVPGAAALAFDHLAALWISRPIFGPGELSTVHTNLSDKFAKKADEWRKRDTAGDGDLGGGSSVSIGSFTRVDGYTDDGSEYTLP